MTSARPRAKTIRSVIAHLEALGLKVYGGYVDLDSGEEKPSCMDYDADDVLKLRALIDKDALWYEDRS